MKQFASRIPWVVVVAFGMGSLGAKPSGCYQSPPDQGPQPNQDSAKPFCYTDPPYKCIAFCVGVHKVGFTPMCNDVSASDLTIEFFDAVLDGAEDLEAEGYEVCPAPDPTKWVTPCDVGIIPMENPPNQDHEVCQPVPPDCVY